MYVSESVKVFSKASPRDAHDILQLLYSTHVMMTKEGPKIVLDTHECVWEMDNKKEGERETKKTVLIMMRGVLG